MGWKQGKEPGWARCPRSVSFAENELPLETACTQLLVFVATPGCNGYPSLDSKESCEYWRARREGAKSSLRN